MFWGCFFSTPLSVMRTCRSRSAREEMTSQEGGRARRSRRTLNVTGGGVFFCSPCEDRGSAVSADCRSSAALSLIVSSVCKSALRRQICRAYLVLSVPSHPSTPHPASPASCSSLLLVQRLPDCPPQTPLYPFHTVSDILNPSFTGSGLSRR